MKHLFFVLMIAITVVLLPYPGVALAADAQNGAKLFTVHCAACHRGGRNVIQADKTLKLDALQTNNIASVEAITAHRGLRSKRTKNNAKLSNFLDKIVQSYIS